MYVPPDEAIGVMETLQVNLGQDQAQIIDPNDQEPVHTGAINPIFQE